MPSPQRELRPKPSPRARRGRPSRGSPSPARTPATTFPVERSRSGGRNEGEVRAAGAGIYARGEFGEVEGIAADGWRERLRRNPFGETILAEAIAAYPNPDRVARWRASAITAVSGDAMPAHLGRILLRALTDFDVLVPGEIRAAVLAADAPVSAEARAALGYADAVIAWVDRTGSDAT